MSTRIEDKHYCTQKKSISSTKKNERCCGLYVCVWFGDSSPLVLFVHSFFLDKMINSSPTYSRKKIKDVACSKLKIQKHQTLDSLNFMPSKLETAAVTLQLLNKKIGLDEVDNYALVLA